MKLKFFKCNICGNIIAMVEESGVPVSCCGEDMEEIIPNTTDGAHEKHVPYCEIKDGIVHVRVGEEDHPMEDSHYIQWIALQTDRGNQRRCLKAGDAPEACFALCDGEKVEAVYEYCNIHGLWVKYAE